MEIPYSQCSVCGIGIFPAVPIKVKETEAFGLLSVGDNLCPNCHAGLIFLKKIATDIHQRIKKGENKDLIALDVMKQFGKLSYTMTLDCGDGIYTTEAFDVYHNSRTYFMDSQFHVAVFKTIEKTIIGTSNRLLKIVEKAEE